MEKCFEITRGFGWPIELWQDKNSFRVVYGKQVKSGLTYSRAAAELGECIMHALACEGNVNSEIK